MTKRGKKPPISRPENPILAKDTFFKKVIYFLGVVERDTFFKKINFKWVGKKVLDTQNQKHCCCCWAFACNGAITAVDAIKRKREVIPLSKQQLLDCMFKHYPMPELEAKLEKRECFGLSLRRAYIFAKEQGIVEEEKYHYIMERSICKCPTDARIVKIDGHVKLDLDKASKEDLEACIRRPLTCGIRIFPSFHNHIGKKVYLGPTDDDIKTMSDDNKEKPYFHALLIVGYGGENGEEFYLVQNSWGKKWGYKGFGKIKRSLATDLSYPLINKKELVG